MDENYDDIRTQVLTDNTAQGVLNHLKALNSNRRRMRTRWIWELLQNARDASTSSGANLSVSIEQNNRELVFKHNGANFKTDEIAHLIYHGSTKVDSDETIGRYGSGFLTTHLLSPEIKVSGQLDTGEAFQFNLKRELGSVNELSQAMDIAWEDFKSSTSQGTHNTDDANTKFQYFLDDRALEAVNEGLDTLRICVPLVLAFNSEFSDISVNTQQETITFKVVERVSLEQHGLQKISVVQARNDEHIESDYLTVQGDKAVVAVPLKSEDGDTVCLPVKDIPRLFLGFPLIGTEEFGFPAIINSLHFTPTEDRDGVYLGQNDDSANLVNQAVVKESCILLVQLLCYIGSQGWHNAYHLATVPTIQDQQGWLNTAWLRQCIKKQFINELLQAPTILNELGEQIQTDRLELPIASTPKAVEMLWDILDGWEGNHERLPRRSEASGWCDAIASWASIEQSEISALDQTVDGRKLAFRIDNISHDPKADPTTHRINRLKLRKDVEAVKWLDRFIGFLEANGSVDILREYRVIPSQEGFLRTINGLHIDQEIPEELKDICHLMDWRIRCELRDTHLESIKTEPGAGSYDNERVLSQLRPKLNQAALSADANFQKASVRLFTWLVHDGRQSTLAGFPVFADGGDSDNLTVIQLPQSSQDEERPFSPISAWGNTLHTYADLIPQTKILSDAFYRVLPHTAVWSMLEQEGFVRINMIDTNEVRHNKFYPDHPLPAGVHQTSDYVSVSDIACRAQIMDRVRDSRARGRLFWQFLTEWLINKDSQGLQMQRASCDCDGNHHYYPAAWIESLRENNWVRLSNEGRDRATAQSLADLLRDSGWDPSSIGKDDPTSKLLEALGIARRDLLLEFIAEDDDTRTAMDEAFTDMLTTVGSNVSYIGQAREYIEDLKNDDGLPEVLAERRKRRRIVHTNQFLGRRVEELVKESLESKGFIVRRTGVGSDFKIEVDPNETDDLVKLELSKGNRTWLVEVKGTRDQDVRMSITQARTARDENDRFLLCVVPVESEVDDLGVIDVQSAMRFVDNMGPRVKDLCDSADEIDDVHDRIITDGPPGVQLEVVSGSARVRVHSSVWEDNGFPLTSLPTRLK